MHRSSSRTRHFYTKTSSSVSCLKNMKVRWKPSCLNSAVMPYVDKYVFVKCILKPPTKQLAAQQHELTLIRHYEALLIARETHGISADLTTSTNISISFQRLTQHLRGLLQVLRGETPEKVLDSNDNLGFDP